MPTRTALRQALLAERRAVSADVRRQWDQSIGQHVLRWWSADSVGTLAVYWPIRGEPDLRQAYAELAERGARLALPVVVGNDQQLKFAVWTPGDALAKDAMGLPVPATAEWVQPDALLIPCVGFNSSKIRLGYGAGFYDRTLEAMPRPLAIGIAYACALAVFDGRPHDVAMDRIITEQGSAAVSQTAATALLPSPADGRGVGGEGAR